MPDPGYRLSYPMEGQSMSKQLYSGLEHLGRDHNPGWPQLLCWKITFMLSYSGTSLPRSAGCDVEDG